MIPFSLLEKQNVKHWYSSKVCLNNLATGVFAKMTWSSRNFVNFSQCNLGASSLVFAGFLSSHYCYPVVFSSFVFPLSSQVFWSFSQQEWHLEFLAEETRSSHHFTQKPNRSASNNLCECTESPSKVSTISLRYWISLPRSNLVVSSFSLEKNVRGAWSQQSKSAETYIYEGFFSTPVRQVNADTMKKVVEHRSKLFETKFLAAHVLCSSYRISRI